MDLLASCRSCLHCLPFFHLSPPSPPPRLAAPASSSSPSLPDASEGTPLDPSCTSGNLPPSNVSPAVQEQDLRPPVKAEEPASAKCDKDEALEDEYSTTTESEALPVSRIVVAPPVSSPPASGSPLPEDADDDKDSTVPELPLHVPFINDITFSASGFQPLDSPITPAPFGAGYNPAGQYPPHHQIHQDQHLEHAHTHHGHENSQNGDEHSHHGHESSQHESSNSHHAHANSHDGYLPEHSQVHAAPDDVVLHTDAPLDDSQVIHEPHTDASHHHSHDSTSVDDVENPIAGHASLDGEHHDKTYDISPTLPLEVSQSTPHLDIETTIGDETSAASNANGASALLETYHSEPVVISVDPHDDDDDEAPGELVGHDGLHLPGHRRRRGHFRDQFKGIKQQIKQGGLHLKQEGSKHMQTIIENMNKQAQQIEQSGSFFMVPRANNN